MLGALRDAATALQPGRLSRLARVLKYLANTEERSDIESIIQDANNALEGNAFIAAVQQRILNQNNLAIGSTLSQKSLIRTSEPDFERIAQNLRLVIDNNPNRPAGQRATKDEIGELKINGLGYNNLLYLATVMTELHVARDAAMPLLLVEEPEAHLHPQLQTRLADGLQQKEETKRVQTIVTSHSPTIAAHVPLSAITILHKIGTETTTAALATITLDKIAKAQLRRLLDVTKATLFFARGLIIVEGITEALLLPVLARRLGKPLEDRAISVIPLCGVEFSTIAQLFGNERLRTPTSLVTDADPTIQNRSTWENATFTAGTQAPRVTNLESQCGVNPTLCVKKASVTFEYDLANAGDKNPQIIARAWEDAFLGMPQNLNEQIIAEIPNRSEKALRVWRAICIADDGRRKAAFAQALATLLDERQEDGTYTIPLADFIVPTYLQEAITHALG